MKSLDLTGNGIGHDGADTLFDGLRQCTVNSSIYLVISPNVVILTQTLETLKLGENDMGDLGIAHLAKVIRNYTVSFVVLLVVLHAYLSSHTDTENN